MWISTVVSYVATFAAGAVAYYFLDARLHQVEEAVKRIEAAAAAIKR